MSLKYSTGYRNTALAAALSAAPVAPIMDGCVLAMYAGAEPASADAALDGATLLATYSVGGAGDPLQWDAPVDGTASKPSAASWSATAVATGTPSFFRYQLGADDGTASTTAVRIQGKVGPVSDPSADLALSSMAIVNGAPLTIDAASATIPATV